MRPLWENEEFVGSINHIIVDEVHCVTQWLSFQTKFRDLVWLHLYLQHRCQWYLTSATLDPRTCNKVLLLIGLDPIQSWEAGKTTEWVCHSNDCPNLHYCVQPMQFSKESCCNITFLVPLGLKESDCALVPFVVYCNSRDDPNHVHNS